MPTQTGSNLNSTTIAPLPKLQDKGQNPSGKLWAASSDEMQPSKGNPVAPSPEHIIAKEGKETGGVSLSVYTNYAKYCGCVQTLHLYLTYKPGFIADR